MKFQTDKKENLSQVSSNKSAANSGEANGKDSPKLRKNKTLYNLDRTLDQMIRDHSIAQESYKEMTI